MIQTRVLLVGSGAHAAAQQSSALHAVGPPLDGSLASLAMRSAVNLDILKARAAMLGVVSAQAAVDFGRLHADSSHPSSQNLIFALAEEAATTNVVFGPSGARHRRAFGLRRPGQVRPTSPRCPSDAGLVDDAHSCPSSHRRRCPSPLTYPRVNSSLMTTIFRTATTTVTSSPRTYCRRARLLTCRRPGFRPLLPRAQFRRRAILNGASIEVGPNDDLTAGLVWRRLSCHRQMSCVRARPLITAPSVPGEARPTLYVHLE